MRLLFLSVLMVCLLHGPLPAVAQVTIEVVPVDTGGADFGGGLLGERDVFSFDLMLTIDGSDDWASNGVEILPQNGAALVYFDGTDANGNPAPFAGPGVSIPERFSTFLSLPRGQESNGRFNGDYTGTLAGSSTPPGPTPVRTALEYDAVWFDAAASPTGPRAVLRLTLDVAAAGAPFDGLGDVFFQPSGANGTDPAQSAVGPVGTQLVGFFSSSTGIQSQGANLTPYNGAFFAMTDSGPAVLYVDDNAPLGGDGASWATAYRTLTPAMDAVSGAGEIRIAQGRYTPPDASTPFSYVGDQLLTVRGGYAGVGAPDPNAQDAGLYPTVLSGDLFGDDANFPGGPDNAETLFTCDPSQQLELEGLILRDAVASAVINQGVMTLTDCHLVENTTPLVGAAVMNDGDLTLRHCRLMENLAGGDGGAICSTNLLRVETCLFQNNISALAGGGAISSSGQLRVNDCAFSKNLAPLAEGGAVRSDFGLMAIERSRFLQNTADTGGAVSVSGASTSIVANSLFSGNFAFDQGGGVYAIGGSYETANCVFTQNSAGSVGSALAIWSDLALANSIVWGNEPDPLFIGGFGDTDVQYSILEGSGGVGAGMIDADPLWVDPLGPDQVASSGDEDWRLQPDSPAIDRGSLNALTPDRLDLDGDGDLMESTPHDLFGERRRRDDPNTLDAGQGPAPVVDLGPIEFVPDITIRYVDDDAAAGGDGLAWTTAYRHLQDALGDVAATEIRVATGVYTPDASEANSVTPGDRDARFELRSGLAVFGGYAGAAQPGARDPSLYPTTLSGDLGAPGVPNDNSYHVVAAIAADASATLDGFIIRDGRADGPSPEDRGAGLFVSPGSWMGLSVGDLNADGHLDIFGSNLGDWATTLLTPLDPTYGDFVVYLQGDMASRWYLGGPGGTMADVGVGSLEATPFGWGTSMSDYDNDGDTDIFMHGGLYFGPVGQGSPASIMLNDGSAVFGRDAVAFAGSTDHEERTGQGVAMGDLDGNGFDDIVSVSNFDVPAANQTTYNHAWGSPFDGGRYAQIFLPTGDLSGDAVFSGNFPDPGTLSVELSSGNDNNWVKVRTLGTVGITTGGAVNRDGIGAVVQFTPKSKPPALQPILGGASYASQDDLEAHLRPGIEEEGRRRGAVAGGRAQPPLQRARRLDAAVSRDPLRLRRPMAELPGLQGLRQGRPERARRRRGSERRASAASSSRARCAPSTTRTS